MVRPSFHDIYMRLALLMSERGTCARTNSAGELMKVGCAIVSTDFRRVFSVGYNGNASGLPNQCDSTEPGKCGCIHAETNAIVSCSADRDEPKLVFCTHLPCPDCAKLIIQLGGVRTVYYLNDYRIKKGLDFFDAVSICHSHMRLLPEPSAVGRVCKVAGCSADGAVNLAGHVLCGTHHEKLLATGKSPEFGT